ncbi:cobaltochelatase subunit CobN [Neorhizobium sp. NPDC001467]|uniref:cobaltochelatase subunit CobN n=1 Tax=Neorhizobium sp. NPDC001467 TaxID=3390595 RepID=UPI003D04BB00
MHILATTSSSLDDLIEPVDLDQTPGDVVVLSFTDSDLNGIASAWAKGGDEMPSLRLANLSELRHPMSVDLWIDKVARHAKLILVRILGGHDRWPYGAQELARVARAQGQTLVMLPGECSERDDRLAEGSTVSAEELGKVLSYFREGGPENMRSLAERLAALARGTPPHTQAAVSVPKAGFYHPGLGVQDRPDTLLAALPGAAIVPILFYRSMLLASDVAPIDALFAALAARNILAVPVFVAGLKDGVSLAFIEQAVEELKPSAIVSATAFASGMDDTGKTVFDRLGIPILQVVIATTRRDAWLENRRGLGPADLAMHVVLPELDGRILAGAVSFKHARDADDQEFAGMMNRPEPDRVEQVATRIASLLRLQNAKRKDRRIAILIPDYPGAPGRTGYAVGLDVPQSVVDMLIQLRDAGYDVADIPEDARTLLHRLESPTETCSLDSYRAFFETLPAEARDPMTATWGSPESDEALRDGVFAFRAARFGNVTVALAPDRGRVADRRTDYHDPERPPRHGLIAFGAWLRQDLDVHALVHVGAHGTLEWLPGKTVALSRNCFPEIVLGGLPVIYPFIVSNPGEAAVAKRRISAVTIGHLPPPLTEAGLSDEQKKLELLVDEYAQADGLDRRRRDRLAKLIVEMAKESGLADDAGVMAEEETDAALARIDAFLCDLKDLAIKDGQHVFGRDADLTVETADPLRKQSARRERQAFLDALDGRHIPAGPSGAPARGRRDVLPTGRNLYASDPRTMPTPTAFELGKRAADEVLRRYLQDHGDWPKSLIIDLWGSACLRSGGEEVAQGLALMGARPIQDPTTGRITGIDILPPASLGRPRVDVSFRISGLFRDMFAPLIALLDAATRAIAARDEAPGDNPLSETARAQGMPPQRIFGSAPGTYGAGIEEQLSSGKWDTREDLGRRYLDAATHAFGGPEGEAMEARGRFAERVGAADLLVHTGDDPGRDLLDGSSDVAFIGGFAAAVTALGGKADVIALDTTDPDRPRARSVVEAITRIVRGRATNPRFIAGQMRHGPRGASEFAETVDRLVGFAETTDAIPAALIEAVYQAYVADDNVRAFILDQNRQAARAIAERFLSARRRGLWHPRRNSVDAELEMLLAEATSLEMGVGT